MEFYNCGTCKNVIIQINKDNCNDLNRIIPNIKGDYEVHIPVVFQTNDGVIVEVSYKQHPMTKEHFIEWILIETNKGFYIRHLNYYDLPKASFKLNDEYVIKAYEYCNIHGLWEEE